MASASAVSIALETQSLPAPSTNWLTSLITAQRPTTPLPAIIATARHRLLNSDLTTPDLLQPTSSSLPLNLSNPAIRELTLKANTVVQVLGIEDLSRSRWEQIELIEAHERGEMTKGREIIRVVPGEDEENQNENGQGSSAVTQRVGQPRSLTTSSGPHKLVLQDWKGQTVFGVELKRVGKVGLGMDVGAKILLREACKVARGVVLLEPEKVVVLGGKVEILHKAWLGGRKKELREAIEREVVENEE